MARKAPRTEDDITAARSRHHEAETREFRLRPWECYPMDATTPECPWKGHAAWAQSWQRAHELRLRILAADPKHYADLD